MRDYKLIQQLHEAIDRKFEQNKYKGTWRNMKDTEILSAMEIEKTELIESRLAGDHINAIDEAADVSLYAVFYADPQRI
jgi:hypothetical protein